MTTNRMRKWLARFWRPLAGVLGLAMMVVWSVGACTPKVHPGRVEVAEGDPLPSGAVLYTARVERAASRIGVVGTVQSVARIHLSARINAYVRAVHASAGSVVTNGQLLVELDAREIREQLAAAEAQLRLAGTEYERTKTLFGSGAATKQALEAAQSAFDSARAAVEGAQVMLTYARIVSPIDGIVTERRVEVGDLAAPGQVLLTVYDPMNMRLEVPVPVRLIGKLAMDRVVDVTLNRAGGDCKGRVTEIVSEVDPASRTQKVKIRLEGLGGAVLPGTFGRVWLEDDPREVVLVPARAVRSVGQLDMVGLMRNGRVVQRLVKTGPGNDGRVEILTGLNDGDVIVLTSGAEG